MHYLLLLIGFILIIHSSDVMVDAAKSIAIRLKIPKMLIALTIVAFGTCAPEIAISFKSVMGANGSIALANVIGSCIVNILLVVAVASILSPIKVKNITIKKELPLLVLVTMVFAIIITNGLLNKHKFGFLNRADGAILLLLFTLFIAYVIKLVKNKETSQKEEAQYGMVKSIAYIITSIIVISYSANLIVDNAIIVAENLGISQKVITMIAIVIGTSLPELFLTVAAARKKEHEMAIGNIIGTNIFNICVVLGLPLFIFDGFAITDFSLIDLGVVLIAALLLYAFAKNDKTLSKKEGLIMLAIFVIYYSYIIFI